MSRLKRNVVANFTANVWSAAMSLIFVPLYIRYLGIEAWGLIGFFTAMQAMFALADMGLSTTLNRELARTTAESGDAQARRDLLRTVETLYWAVSLLAGAIVIVGAPFFAAKWLHIQHLSILTARHAIMLMGVVIALQLPLGLYTGGLIGLQQQVMLNAINVVAWTARSAGAVAILAFVSPTVTAYFSWQVLVSALHTSTIGIVLWRNLGRTAERAHFRRELLAAIWRFSAGMVGITAMATLLTQIDKIVLSRIISLSEFGYYSLAAAVATSLYRLINPLFTSFFPRFTELLALRDEDGLKSVYHTGSQFMCVVLVPAAAVVALFSREALFLWTRNAVTADRAHLLLSLLVIGTCLNGIMSIPYAMQLAHGWTRLAFWTNAVASIVFLPLLIVGVLTWGPVGAAAAWPLLNVGYMVLMIERMHRRILPTEQTRWFLVDVGRPVAASLAVAIVGRLLFPSNAGSAVALVCLAVILFLTTAAAALAAPATRQLAFMTIAKILGRDITSARRDASAPPS